MDILDAMAQLGAGASWIGVWRLEDGGETYLGRHPVDVFSIDWVKETFGGGKYRARGINDQNKFVKAQSFTIAGDKKVPTAAAPTNGNGQSNGNGNGHSSGGMPKFLETILVASIPVIAGAIARKILEDPKTDPLMLALLNKSSKGESVSAGELVTLLDNARRESRDETREMMQAIQAASGDRGNNASSWADVVRDNLPPLLETFKREQDDRPPRTTRVVATATSGEQPVSPIPDNAPRWIKRVKPYMATIVRWADTNKTPEVKAEGVVDDMPEEDAVELGNHTRSTTFIADVFRYLPELASTPARKEWFVRFLQHLVECFTETEQAEDAGGVRSEGMPSGTSASTTEAANG